MQFPQPTDFNGWVFSLTSFPEIWFKACALSMYRYVWYLEIRDEFCECFFPQDFHANKNCSLQKTSTFVRILVQASQFDNYWWVMHLDSQKTFEAETTTKNPQQKVSDIRILYRYFVCFSESVRFSVFFFRFQLETKWTYVDSSIFSFSTSQAQKWTVRWFVCVCWHFSFPPFFFRNEKTSADLRLTSTEVSPCVAARTTSSHALTCIQSWGAGFFKEEDDFLRVFKVKQGRTNIIMERKGNKNPTGNDLEEKTDTYITYQ